MFATLCFGRRAAAILAVMSGALATRAELNLLDSYHGKYAGQNRFEKAVHEVEAAYDAGLKSVAEKLGLAPASGKTITVVLRDARDENAEILVPYAEAPFKTRWEGDDAQIILHAEFMMTGRYDPPRSLVHELTHAVVRTHISPEAYKGVPTWLREGLAVWAADQIEEKAVALHCFSDQDAEQWVRGLQDTRDAESLTRYAEYGLAIEFLYRQKGAAAVTKLVADVVSGSDAAAAVARAGGSGWDEFTAAARAYAVQRVRGLRPAGMEDYRRILGLDHARQYKEVRSAGPEFLKKHRDSALCGNVLYYLTKAHRMTRNPGAAKNTLYTLKRKHAHDCSLLDGAVYQLGAAQVQAQQWRPAIHTFEELLRDFPDAPRQDRAVYNLALCHAKGGNKNKAREYIALFDRSFPQSNMAEKMAEVRREVE